MQIKRFSFGKKFVDAGVEFLKLMWHMKMIGGCLVDNPSNKFYEHIGGKYIKQRIFEKLQLPENVYYYDNI